MITFYQNESDRMPTQREDLAAQLRGDLTEQIVDIRQRRRWIEEQWLRAHRVWMAQETDYSQFSSVIGPKQYHIPFTRKAVERTITRAMKIAMPNVRWHEVTPLGDVSDEKLANVNAFMSYVLRKRIKSKTNISQLVRSLVLYNRCHLKTSVVVKNGQVWPAQRVVDPFSFYIYPETAVTVDESDLTFEDFLLSYERYQGFVQKGIVSSISVSDLTAPVWPYHLTERLSHQGLVNSNQETLPTVEDRKGVLTKTPTPFVELTEVWLRREDVLHQCYVVWNLRVPKIVSFFQSPYDEPMYRSAVHRSLPNESYTNSMMDDVINLESLANDQLNSFQRAVRREQGVYGVDVTDRQRTDDLSIEDGALWKFNGDPREAMNFIAPPNTSVNQLRAWQIYLGLINAMGATGTIAEGQPGRNMPRAGNAVNNLVSLAMADTQDLSELIEQEVLTPSLGDIYKVSVQFIPDDQLIRIPGGKSLTRNSSSLKVEDIYGDYEFEWVGSLQFQDEQVRAQRMMIFLNMLPQLQPMLQQMGYGFNLVELIQNIWRYSLGERSLQKIILPLEELQNNISMEQIERMMTSDDNKSISNSVSGLKYNLPNVTNGFVKQS
ncbi:MAG: hypothetical protein ACRCZI_14955 [Cetobacterium sp.]